MFSRGCPIQQVALKDNHLIESEEKSPFAQAAANFTKDLLGLIAHELSPAQHRLFVLMYDRGLSLERSATEMGMTQPAASQMHARLIARFRKRLAAQGITEARHL